MDNYKGIDIEPWKDGGYIVELYGDEIYCDTTAEAKELIDSYLDE